MCEQHPGRALPCAAAQPKLGSHRIQALCDSTHMKPWSRLPEFVLQRPVPAAAGPQPAQAPRHAVQEVQLLGEAAGLTLAATYGDMDMGIGLADEEAFRLVACLQRPPQGAAGQPSALRQAAG